MNTEINSNSISEMTPDTAAPAPAPNMKPSSGGAAARNIFVGGLWCVGGIVITALTYNAVKDTGGPYIIAWGAILFGGLQFLKGLVQLAE